MSRFVIDGGYPLSGTIKASGNKNAALKLLPACLLTSEPVLLRNIPDIQDVANTILLLQDLGVDVERQGADSWRIHAKRVLTTDLNSDLASRTRASFVFSGPMLARMGQVTLPLPGGDVIGGRPLDTHISALEAVRDLCRFLCLLGARIDGIGTNRLTIEGVERLSGAEFAIGADFMEVGSFIGAAAVTGGEIRITHADPQQLGMIELMYRKLGVRWRVEGQDVVVSKDGPLKIEPALGGRMPAIKPMPWPGFPPDLMSIAVVMATQAAGSVLLHDWMYESRFFFVDNLVFMGARIVLCDPHRVLVQGPSRLVASPHGVPSPDIRAGMAMVLAALCAEGSTTIHNIRQIDRGYERIDEKLLALGAKIERVD
jgi:UDP-N-acetylglucosamine 1-carboxyvinyltransferase